MYLSPKRLSHSCPHHPPPRYYLGVSISLTVLVWMGVSYQMVKKGSSVGKRLVMHPKLCPERPTPTK